MKHETIDEKFESIRAALNAVSDVGFEFEKECNDVYFRILPTEEKHRILKEIKKNIKDNCTDLLLHREEFRHNKKYFKITKQFLNRLFEGI